MIRQAKRKKNGGFTLPEVLLTVAILVVLLALAMLPVNRLQREIRQTALDGKAEILFMAAQNRMTQLQAAGHASAYQNGALPLGLIPADAEDGRYEEQDLSYVTSEGKLGNVERLSAAAWILPEDRVDKELWDADWVVEFDPASGSVYAVFYSEKGMQYEPQEFNYLRSRSERLKNGATMGYYGGDSIEANDTGDLKPKVEIENGERLTVEIVCDMYQLARLQFDVTLSDESGHTTAPIRLRGAEVKLVGHTYTAELVLDDLTEGAQLRFAQQSRFCDQTSGEHLVPGEQLTVTVKVSSQSDQANSAVKKLVTNSLFDYVEDNAGGGRTACWRHRDRRGADRALLRRLLSLQRE